MHGGSSNHKLNFRAGPTNYGDSGNVLSIKGDGNMVISPATKTDNYSRWDNHDVHMRFYGTTSKIEMYAGYIASDIIRSADSQLRLFNDYSDLKAKFGNNLTELWNEQVRIHGSLYVDDSGTIGNDLTVGGNISGSGNIDITGDLTCDDLEAHNGEIGFLRVGQSGVPGSGELIVEGSATINGDIDVHIFGIEISNIAYAVIYSDYIAGYTDVYNNDTLLNDARDGGVANVNGKLLSEKNG